MIDYISAICKVKAEAKFQELEEATGFFVDNSRLLTCNHLFKNFNKDTKINISIRIFDQSFIDVVIIEQNEEYDIAILEVKDKTFKSLFFLNLDSSTLLTDEKLKLFGYPYTSSESFTGVNLSATVNSINSNFNSEVKHDLLLTMNTSEENDGLSGSPLLNEVNDVVGLFKRQDSHTCGGISIRRAKEFLLKNRIPFKKDCLACFSQYSDGIFEQYETLEDIFTLESEEIFNKVSPQKIIELKKGNLFYPNKMKDIDEIIRDLKLSRNINAKLWQGWIELLSYVKFLSGDYENLNKIFIPLSVEKKYPLKFFKKNIELSIAIDFYFSEKEKYSSIVKKFIHKKLSTQDLGNNICYIFNSHKEHFGKQIQNLSNIIIDISEPKNSVPNISRQYIGVLSLAQLRDSVINSNSMDSMKINLNKKIENAIRKS